MIRDLGKTGMFLLNQCPPMRQSARVQDGVRALEASGVLISPMISARVDFQDAARAGLGVTELHPSGPAAREFRELWTAIAQFAVARAHQHLRRGDFGGARQLRRGGSGRARRLR